MGRRSNNTLIGAILIGTGVGLTVAGLVMVVPACLNWSAGVMEQAVRRARETVETAASSLGEFAGHAQARFGEAAKTARATTSKAAGMVENAARQVREYTS